MSKERGRIEPERRTAAGGASLRAADLYASAVKLESAGKFPEAEALYRQILARDPAHADSVYRLGHIALRFGRNDLAVTLFGGAVRLNPREPLYLFNLANALLYVHRAEEAAALYRQAVSLKPDFDEAHHNLGLALCALNQLDAGFASIREGFALRTRPGTPAEPLPQTSYKTRHDREQLEYLIELGAVNPAAFGAWQQRSPKRFNELFAAVKHIEGGARLAAPAVNPGTDVVALQRQWEESKPNLVVIDELLTANALDELRRYCLGSTIWQRTYEGGYLGALPESGFACPLLAQIAGELRERYPAVLREHTLNLWWAFKYDSQLKGINLHADFAAVNVNFWITPDEANLDAEGGGLIVWDTPAPLDWDFATYNRSEATAREFLVQSGAKPIVVPYRANRAVIFDSNLFHETDQIHFKEGYRNRRINITLLYGWRA